jgi:hypothetical protein
MKTYLLAISAAVLLSIYSCKKKDTIVTTPASTTNTASTSKFYLHIHTNISNTEADSGLVVHDTISGRNFKLDTAQFFISGITLHRSDSSLVKLTGVYLLKTISQETFLTGQVPVGNYAYISFDVGVDSVANSKSPSSFPSSNPLSQASMYNGGWFGGTFIFMNISGYADTSSNQSGKYAAFNYQTGTNPELKHVILPPKAFSVVSNQTHVIHLIADYGKLLQVVDFKSHPTSNPWNNLPVIETIANNIPTMFRYE